MTAKLTGYGAARLAVADNADLGDPAYFGPVAPEWNVARFTATGLDPNTRYWYAIEQSDKLDTTMVGRFTTHPPIGEPASITLISSADSGQTPTHPGIGDVLAPQRVSNHPVLDEISSHPSDPLMFLHLGDLTYYDPGSRVWVPDATAATYRRMYDDVLAQARWRKLAQSLPIGYVYDGHDYGPNDADRTAMGRHNATTVYRERVPSYPLPAGDGAHGIYHSFQIGRVLFVMTDCRTDRTPNSEPDDEHKSILGQAQFAWLDSLLASTTAQALVWVNPTSWLGRIDDSFGGGYTTERDKLVALFATHGWLDRMCILGAGYHALGICSARNNPYGGFPIFGFSAIDAAPSQYTGEMFDVGFRAGRNQYGVLAVTDDGAEITITGTGYVGSDPCVSHDFTVSGLRVPPGRATASGIAS
ncbi:MAG: alkaline phosphatase D family protein [Micromonosporaceae bacterium]